MREFLPRRAATHVAAVSTTQTHVHAPWGLTEHTSHLSTREEEEPICVLEDAKPPHVPAPAPALIVSSADIGERNNFPLSPQTSHTRAHH